MSGKLAIRPWPPAFTVSESVAGEFAEAINALGDTPQLAPWCSYLGEVDGRPVAMGGFKATPDREGAVELGYLTFALERGQGFAKQFAAALVETARAHGARTLTANTLPEENASTAVLRANGFERAGEGHDEDVGSTWAWRRNLSGDGR